MTLPVVFCRPTMSSAFTGDIFLINRAIRNHGSQNVGQILPHCRRLAGMVAINLPDEKVLPAVRGRSRWRPLPSRFISAAPRTGARPARELINADWRRNRCADAYHSGAQAKPVFEVSPIRVSISSFKISAANTAGSVAAISQSGSVASLLQAMAGRHGLSFLASTGNQEHPVTSVRLSCAYAIEDPDRPAYRGVHRTVPRNPPALFPRSRRNAHAARKAGHLTQSRTNPEAVRSRAGTPVQW